MADRSARREARYALAKELGFSVDERRRMRDLSEDRIREIAAREQRRLSRKPAIDRSPREQQRLRTLRDFRQSPLEFKKRHEPKSRRVNNWSKWSAEKDFPEEIRRMASRLNRANGLSPLNSYGYRIAYHWYVNNESIRQAIDRQSVRDEFGSDVNFRGQTTRRRRNRRR